MFRQVSTVALLVFAALDSLALATAQESKEAGRKKQITNSIGMKLVLIPAGEFVAGSPKSDKNATADERPQHRVKLTKAYYLGTCHVTVGQFRRFVKDTGHDAGAEWKAPGFPQTDDHPVVCVSWHDAAAFCRWLGRKEGKTYRLPTEAEWEYACRAGTTTRYSFGDDEKDLRDYAWYDGNSLPVTHAVGQKRPNPWRLYDMYGNAWQWCADWYGPYSGSPADDPAGPASGACRVLRGGAWDFGPGLCRSANRSAFTPDLRSLIIGFRVARTP